MGFLAKLFGKKAATAAAPPPATRCPHTTLVPKWTAVADMGKADKATGWTCQGCRQTFSGDEGRALLRTEAARVQRMEDELPY